MENDHWLKKSGVSRNQGFKKSGFYSMIFILQKEGKDTKFTESNFRSEANLVDVVSKLPSLV